MTVVPPKLGGTGVRSLDELKTALGLGTSTGGSGPSDTFYFGSLEGFPIVGDGVADDTVSAQAHITYANVNNRQIAFRDGQKIRTTSTLNCSGWTRIKGKGGQLQKDNGNNKNGNIDFALGPYTGFFFDHDGIGLNCASKDSNAWDRADLEDFLIVRPQALPVANTAWAPRNADFDISLAGCSGQILGVECLRSTNFLRIDRNYGHQAVIDRIKGQVFKVGIQIKCSLDSVYLRMAHFWPFWTGGYGPAADPVLNYMLTAHIGLHVLRADGLSIGDLFCFAPRATMLIDALPTNSDGIGGTLNNGTAYKIYNDNGANAITAVAAAAGFVFRCAFVESYGAPRPYNFNGIDNGAPNSLLEIGNYWSNNQRNSHAAAQASKACININRFVEGAYNTAGNNSPALVGTNGGIIEAASWRKADAISSPYSALTPGPRFVGNVRGPLGEGLTTVTTDPNGLALWAHNCGQQPVYSEFTIHNPGASGAAIFQRTGMDDTNLYGRFTTSAGAPCGSQSDIIVSWKCFATHNLG